MATIEVARTSASRQALRAFLEGIIDYAGMYPPARLALETAFRNHLRYSAGSDAFMLGRFVVPASRIDDLRRLSHEASATDRRAVRLAVLWDAGGSEREILSGIRAAIHAARHAGLDRDGLCVEVLESRFSAETFEASGASRLVAFVSSLRGVVADAGMPDLPIFLEAGSANASPELDAVAIEVLGAVTRGGRVGFKLRCGGDSPGRVPAVERVARVIATCRDAKVPLKCTAGLHRALARGGSDGPAHGFLNVFGAGILAASRGLPLSAIHECLTDTDANSFGFADGEFTWRGERATVDEIRQARRDLMIGFGSCSFDEPREDLRSIGLLD